MSGLVDWMQERFEGALNGLMLIRIPERIYQRVDHAECYAEVWSGHPGNFNKRFMLNGKGTYLIRDPIVEDNHCNFIYPEIPLRHFHLVQGVNAVQLSVDRGLTFVGNFIVYNACVRTYLVPNHPDLAAAGLKHFTACVGIRADAIGDQINLCLDIEPGFLSLIESVEFHGCYTDFDDNGGGEYAWRGFTQSREPRYILGSAQQGLYRRPGIRQ